MEIVVTIIGVLIALSSIGYIMYKTYEEEKVKKSIPACLITLGILVIVLGQSFTIIPTGYTGVSSKFGQIDNRPLSNGLNFKMPFVQHIELINNKQQDVKYYEDSLIESETSERNTVQFSDITVTCQILPERSAWIYANVTNADNLIPETLVASAVKSASKTLNPVDVTNRSVIEPKTLKVLQESIDGKYGENTIKINKVVISQIGFDKEYDERISKKQQAQIEYETQQINNKKSVEKAEADAKVKQRQAEADAKAKEISSNAEANANKKISNSLTKELIDYELAQARKSHGWITVQGANSIVTKDN